MEETIVETKERKRIRVRIRKRRMTFRSKNLG